MLLEFRVPLLLLQRPLLHLFLFDFPTLHRGLHLGVDRRSSIHLRRRRGRGLRCSSRPSRFFTLFALDILDRLLDAIEDIDLLWFDVYLLEQIEDLVQLAEPAEGAEAFFLDLGHVPVEPANAFLKSPAHRVPHPVRQVGLGMFTVYLNHHAVDLLSDFRKDLCTGQRLVIFLNRLVEVLVGDEHLPLVQAGDNFGPQISPQLAGEPRRLGVDRRQAGIA